MILLEQQVDVRSTTWEAEAKPAGAEAQATADTELKITDWHFPYSLHHVTHASSERQNRAGQRCRLHW